MIIQNKMTSLPQNKIRSRQIQPTFNGLGKITHIEYHPLSDEHFSNLKKFIPNLDDVKKFFLEKGIIDENHNLVLRAKKIIIEEGNDQLPETLAADEILMLGGEQETLIADKITLSGTAKLTRKAEAEEIKLEGSAENHGNLIAEHALLTGKSKNKGQIEVSKNVHMSEEMENHGNISSETLQLWDSSKNMDLGNASNKKTWMNGSAENRGKIICSDSIELLQNSKNSKTGTIETHYLSAKDNADNDGSLSVSSLFSFIHECKNKGKFPKGTYPYHHE